MLLRGWRGGGRDIPFAETTSQAKVLQMQQFVALEGPFRTPQARDKGSGLDYKSSYETHYKQQTLSTKPPNYTAQTYCKCD